MTDTTEFTAAIVERTVCVRWPDNERRGATPPPDGWQDRAWAQERTLHEVDEGSVSGCSVLRWRDDPRPDAELVAVSLALVTGRPAPAAAVSVPAADRAAEEPCSQFPDACPNLRPVLPDPPHHDGGVRCACGEERYKAGQLRAAVLREAVRRIEDGEPLPDRDLRFRRGADWVLDALRRQAAEAADTTGSCAEPGPVVPAQPGTDTPVVAYRSHSGSLLRCLTHAPDQVGVDSGAFHPVTAGDLPDGGICTYRAPGVECGVDVLNPQQPKEA